MSLFDKKSAVDFSEKLGKEASQEQIDEVEKKLDSMNRGPVAKIWDSVLKLWKAFKSPETPLWKKSAIIGSLIYLVLPIDIISDFVPALGLIDDVFVIGFTFKQVFDITAQKIIQKVKEPIDQKIKAIIDSKLNEAFKNSLISTMITFFIMTVGLLFVIIKPFGQDIAFDIASVIFIGLMFWGTYRTIRNVRNAWPWIKSIFKERGIKKGIIAEVKNQYKAVAIYDKLLETGSKFLDAFNEIPDTTEILDHYVRHFRKKVIIFGAAIGVYCLIVYWILKPFLINQFGGLTTWQLYLYPIVHIYKVFKA
ncbi:YkvA family protein [Treponema sp.]|uniref:YkvA family protein n=1 Tax=Treponema sp. TaxID=166 RepID=UPI00298E9C91|nr:DUF1232 domain-containing protein [Treponema sp.]MCR5614512.1 DUF1232 domain-containing protein [Treponema sp.]